MLVNQPPGLMHNSQSGSVSLVAFLGFHGSLAVTMYSLFTFRGGALYVFLPVCLVTARVATRWCYSPSNELQTGTIIHDSLMGAACLHPGFCGMGPKVLFQPRAPRPLSCVGGGGGEGGGRNEQSRTTTTRGEVGSGDSRWPRRRGGGGGGGWRSSLASAPRGVGGGATRGTGVGNKRPFSAPWPG